MWGCVLLLLMSQAAQADGRPSLARLTFRVDPARMAEFAGVYEAQILPELLGEGLVPSSIEPRATPEGVFSRLFEFDTPLVAIETWRRLSSDSLLVDTLHELAGFARAGDDSLRVRFGLYDLAAGPGRTVRAGPGSRRESWHTLTMADGLPSQSIGDLVQREDGSIWGESHYSPGIFRFDGARIRVYSESDGVASQLTLLYEDDQRDLWVGCFGAGVARFDGERFVYYNTEDGLADNRVFATLQADDGRLWFATGGGISIWDGARFVNLAISGDQVRLASPPFIRSIFQDSQGRVWIGTRRQGLLSYDGAGWVQYTAEDGLPTRTSGGRTSYQIVSIAEESDGDLWLATNSGVVHFDGATFTAYAAAEGLPTVRGNVIVNDVAFDADGDLWISTWGGVSRFDGVEFITYTPADGLPHSRAGSILPDDSGNLWIATGGGLTRFTGRQVLSVTTEQALMSGAVMSVGQDRAGTLWFGSWMGMSTFDGRHFSTTDSLAKVDHTWETYEDSRGRLWFAGFRYESDPVRYIEDGELHTLRVDGEALYGIRTTIEDADGNLWFGGDARPVPLRRYDGHELQSFSHVDGRDLVHVSDIAADGNNLWIATQAGLVHFDGQDFAFVTIDGVEEPGVSSVELDRDGNLWVGTAEGVACYDGSAWRNYRSEDGLQGKQTFDIIQDRRGTMWFGFWDGGITRYDGTAFQSLTMADGLISDSVQDLLEAADSTIWIATEGGVTQYRSQDTPPSAEIVNVTSDREYGAVHEVHLSTSQDYLAFDCLGSSLSTPADRFVYAYRMDGMESEWSWTPDPRIVYHDLPRGDYRFEVKAVDLDLNYSEPATVHVVVAPAYGQLALLGALAVSLVGLVAAGRYGQRRRRERDDARTELIAVRRQRIEVQHHDIERWTIDDFVAVSPSMQTACSTIRDLQRQDGRVLITGEAGSGKELAARAIHAGSQRAAAPFVAVRCASLPRDVQSLEERTRLLSELFGHTAGLAAGVDEDHDGLVLQADGGVLFLDEVALLPLPMQSHLCRVLTEGQVRRTGATDGQSIDVRVMASSSEDLETQVELGGLRPELYEFLAQSRLAMPSLSDRPQDMPALVEGLLQDLCDELAVAPVVLSDEALDVLQNCALPGNVRQLRRILEQAVRQHRGDGPLLPGNLALPS